MRIVFVKLSIRGILSLRVWRCNRVRLSPLFEDASELMIRNNDMFIYLRDPVDIIQHPSQDGILANFQQWFREVLRQLTEPCGVTRRNYNTFHIFLFFLEHELLELHELSYVDDSSGQNCFTAVKVVISSSILKASFQKCFLKISTYHLH